MKIWDKIKNSFQLDKKINLSYDVKNTQRAIGTRLSHYLLSKFGNSALKDDVITINLNGSRSIFRCLLSKELKL